MTSAWLFMLKCIYVIYIHLCVNCERQWSPVVNSVESVVRLPELKSWFCSFDTCKFREVSESSSAWDPASVTRGCPSHFSHVYIKWSACYTVSTSGCVLLLFCLWLFLYVSYVSQQQQPQNSFRKKVKLSCLPRIVWHNHFAQVHRNWWCCN